MESLNKESPDTKSNDKTPVSFFAKEDQSRVQKNSPISYENEQGISLGFEALKNTENNAEELPSLFQPEQSQKMYTNPYAGDSLHEEPRSDASFDEIFELLSFEKSALESQIKTLQKTLAGFEASLEREMAQIDMDISAQESRASQMLLQTDAQFRETSQTQIFGQIAMLRHNRRLYEEQMLREIKNMELSLADKKKEFMRLQTEIRMLKE